MPPLPKGLGNEIMAVFGVPPSKRLGDIIKQLKAAVEEGELEPNQPASHYVAWLDAHRVDYGLDPK